MRPFDLNQTLPQRRRFPAATILVLWASLSGALGASITVPNASFEFPAPSPFFPYSTILDNWQKTPKPDWYDDGGGLYLWEQLSGIFKNTPQGSSDHIVNCDGAHAAWLMAVPEV